MDARKWHPSWVLQGPHAGIPGPRWTVEGTPSSSRKGAQGHGSSYSDRLVASGQKRLEEYANALLTSLTPGELKEISDVGNTYHFRMAWGEHYEDDDRS
ncbi:hypothetical protein HYALB_00006826 [Hymenoscyphus albidus]|uniref:Uncharacterized protein n=1 Tax=Hymenoscyphus albidus TaxID=595503 RepID=A0A9N9LKW4_9HELO|nr:hypothetical protein HYALB_00006826 [Hymenoscyphus albidus]